MKAKMAFASFVESFFLTRLLKRFSANFLSTKVRSSAAGILCFGFLASAFSLMELIMHGGGEFEVMELGLCIGLMLGSALLCLSGRLWCEVLDTSFLGGLFDPSGRVVEGDFSQSEHHSSGLGVFMGVLLGILSFFVSPSLIVVAFVVAVAVALIFIRPEFGLLLLALFLCFLDGLSLAVLTALVLLAYILKAARGKRVFKLGVEDIFVFLLFLLWLVGAVAQQSDPLSLFLGFGIYIIFAKLLGGKEQIRQLSCAFIFSLIAFCAVALLWGDTVLISSSILDKLFRYAGDINKPLEVSLDIIMMLLPIAAAAYTKTPFSKVCGFVGLAAGLFTLLFCTSPGALFCFVISLAVLAILLKRKLLPLVLALVLSVGISLVFYPQIFSLLFNSFVPLLKNTLGSVASGLGYLFNTDFLSLLFGRCGLPEMELDFWADMIFRFGVLGFGVFVLAFVFCVRKALGALKISSDKMLSAFVLGVLISLCMLLVRGLTADIADDQSVFCFFWMIMGTLCGACKVVALNSDKSDLF
jgi:hypothetical protein